MTDAQYRNKAKFSASRFYVEFRFRDRIYQYPNYEIGGDRLVQIYQAYDLGMRRDQIMFYLEPKVIQLDLTKQCLENKITPLEYKKRTWAHENSLGNDILDFDDLWGGGTDQLTREWKYWEFDMASEDCAECGKWYHPPADWGELEDVASINTKDFWRGLKQNFARAEKGLKYILKDYNIRLEDIPKTIGE